MMNRYLKLGNRMVVAFSFAMFAGTVAGALMLVGVI
jgi:hypothetical protein